MPIPFLPLLGGAARALGGGMVTRMLGGIGRAAGGAASGGGSLASLATLASTAGLAARGLTSLAFAAPATVRAFQGFSAVILNSRQEYRKVSGSIAGAFARLERQQLLLSAKTAARVAPGTVALAQAYGELSTQTREFTERRQRIGNVAGVIAARAGESLARTINVMFGDKIDGILDYLEELVGIGKGGGEAQKEWRDYFRRLRDGRPMNRTPGGRD